MNRIKKPVSVNTEKFKLGRVHILEKTGPNE